MLKSLPPKFLEFVFAKYWRIVGGLGGDRPSSGQVESDEGGRRQVKVQGRLTSQDPPAQAFGQFLHLMMDPPGHQGQPLSGNLQAE
jgi:hypothetical protein